MAKKNKNRGALVFAVCVIAGTAACVAGYRVFEHGKKNDAEKTAVHIAVTEAPTEEPQPTAAAENTETAASEPPANAYEELCKDALRKNAAQKELSDNEKYLVETSYIQRNGRGIGLCESQGGRGMGKAYYDVYLTEDGGDTWHKQENQLETSNDEISVCCFGKYAAAVNYSPNECTTRIYISDDYGRTFERRYANELLPEEYAGMDVCADFITCDDNGGTVTIGWRMYGDEKGDYFYTAVYDGTLSVVKAG